MSKADKPPPLSLVTTTGIEPEKKERSYIKAGQWDEIIKLCGEGVPMGTAATIAGIRPGTMYSLKHRYEKGKVKKGGVAQRMAMLKSALAEAEAISIRKVRAGDKGWQGNAWYLERLYPDRYGQRGRLDINATVKTLHGLSDREISRLARQAALSLDLSAPA